jgi:hypothetical protein
MHIDTFSKMYFAPKRGATFCVFIYKGLKRILRLLTIKPLAFKPINSAFQHLIQHFSFASFILFFIFLNAKALEEPNTGSIPDARACFSVLSTVSLASCSKSGRIKSRSSSGEWSALLLLVSVVFVMGSSLF